MNFDPVLTRQSLVKYHHAPQFVYPKSGLRTLAYRVVNKRTGDCKLQLSPLTAGGQLNRKPENPLPNSEHEIRFPPMYERDRSSVGGYITGWEEAEVL